MLLPRIRRLCMHGNEWVNGNIRFIWISGTYHIGAWSSKEVPPHHHPGTVNTQGFVWKFLMCYIWIFIHLVFGQLLDGVPAVDGQDPSALPLMFCAKLFCPVLSSSSLSRVQRSCGSCDGVVSLREHIAHPSPASSCDQGARVGLLLALVEGFLVFDSSWPPDSVAFPGTSYICLKKHIMRRLYRAFKVTD